MCIQPQSKGIQDPPQLHKYLSGSALRFIHRQHIHWIREKAHFFENAPLGGYFFKHCLAGTCLGLNTIFFGYVEVLLAMLMLAQLLGNLNINLPMLQERMLPRWGRSSTLSFIHNSFRSFCSPVFSKCLHLRVFFFHFVLTTGTNKGATTGRVEVLHNFQRIQLILWFSESLGLLQRPLCAKDVLLIRRKRR